MEARRAIGRKHYYNPVTNVREDYKLRKWKVVRDPDAHEAESSASEDEGEDEGAGETFVAREREDVHQVLR